MQQIIVDVIVAAAALFIGHSLYRNFFPKRAEKVASCGSCPQCAASDTAPVTVRLKD
jgi:hypothetical protein